MESHIALVTVLCCAVFDFVAQDVYSFGIVMWELWTLREPFEGINYHALLHMMSTSQEAVTPPLPGVCAFLVGGGGVVLQ